MRLAFNKFFAMLMSWFIAGEKAGNAVVNLTTWAEEASGELVDTSRAERIAKRKQLMRDLGITEEDFRAAAKEKEIA